MTGEELRSREEEAVTGSLPRPAYILCAYRLFPEMGVSVTIFDASLVQFCFLSNGFLRGH
jgi:hypothetical protein